MRFGVCLPMGAAIMVTDHSPVSSMAELLADTVGDRYFHDTSLGVVYMMIVGTYNRPNGDVDPCGLDNSACLTKVITATGGGQVTPPITMDCTQRDLSLYATAPLPSTG